MQALIRGVMIVAAALACLIAALVGLWWFFSHAPDQDMFGVIGIGPAISGFVTAALLVVAATLVKRRPLTASLLCLCAVAASPTLWVWARSYKLWRMPTVRHVWFAYTACALVAGLVLLFQTLLAKRGEVSVEQANRADRLGR